MTISNLQKVISMATLLLLTPFVAPLSAGMMSEESNNVNYKLFAIDPENDVYGLEGSFKTDPPYPLPEIDIKEIWIGNNETTLFSKFVVYGEIKNGCSYFFWIEPNQSEEDPWNESVLQISPGNAGTTYSYVGDTLYLNTSLQYLYQNGAMPDSKIDISLIEAHEQIGREYYFDYPNQCVMWGNYYLTSPTAVAHTNYTQTIITYEGDEVILEGYGTTTDGDVVKAEWTNEKNQTIFSENSSNSKLTLHDLSAGNYTYYFRVKNDNGFGFWSEPATTKIVVKEKDVSENSGILNRLQQNKTLIIPLIIIVGIAIALIVIKMKIKKKKGIINEVIK